MKMQEFAIFVVQMFGLFILSPKTTNYEKLEKSFIIYRFADCCCIAAYAVLLKIG